MTPAMITHHAFWGSGSTMAEPCRSSSSTVCGFSDDDFAKPTYIIRADPCPTLDFFDWEPKSRRRCYALHDPWKDRHFSHSIATRQHPYTFSQGGSPWRPRIIRSRSAVKITPQFCRLAGVRVRPDLRANQRWKSRMLITKRGIN